MMLSPPSSSLTFPYFKIILSDGCWMDEACLKWECWNLILKHFSRHLLNYVSIMTIIVVKEIFHGLKNIERDFLTLHMKSWFFMLNIYYCITNCPKWQSQNFSIHLYVEYDRVCREVELVHVTSTSSVTPLGYLTNLSSNWSDTLVGFCSSNPKFLNTERGIKLILAPRSH